MTANILAWTDQPPRIRGAVRIVLVATLLAMSSFCPQAVAAVTDLKLLSKSDTHKYRTAFKAAKRGQWSAAYQRARKGRSKLPRKLLRWLDMTQRGTTASFREITRFIRRNPAWPRMRRLRRRAEESIDEHTGDREILSWFKTHPPITTDGRIAFGEALIATGKVTEGEALLRRAWISGRFNRRAERLFLRQHRKMFTRDDHRQRLDGLLWKRHYRSARRMYRRVSKEMRDLTEARISLRRSRGGGGSSHRTCRPSA